MSETFWTEYALRNNEVKKDTKLSLEFLLEDIPKDCSILEVGCNNGYVMAHLQSMGYHNLTGLDSNPDAIEMAREYHPDMDFILEDVVNLNKKFDLIIFRGLLIHTHSQYLIDIIRSIFNNSKKYILGLEYYNPTLLIKYYRETMIMYKRDYVMIIRNLIENVKLVKSITQQDGDEIDTRFLFEKM